jgi:phosphotransferase system HPr (HPr) family protein
MRLLAPTAVAHWNGPKAITRTLKVTHQQGLHLRPCSAIVAVVGRHRAQVTIQKGAQSVNAGSVLDLLTLAATQGTELVLTAIGPEAEEALEAVVGLFSCETELACCH